MKYTSSLIALLLFTLTSTAQLKGDYGVWAKTPQTLKHKEFQLEYGLQKINQNNPGRFYYRDAGKVTYRELDDYSGYSFLGFNLRYGITDRLEISAELAHMQYASFNPEVFNRNNFGLVTPQLKYKVNKTPILKSTLSVFGGAKLDVFNNTTRTDIFDTSRVYEYPFANWHHIGVRIETKLHENFLLRYGTSIYRNYTRANSFNASIGRWYRRQDFTINAQYNYQENLGAFAEYNVGILDGGDYQLGVYYNLNDDTQLMGAYYHGLLVTNSVMGNHTADCFKLSMYKSF